jgi:hypothetical protein
VEPLPETDAAFRAAMVEVIERSRLRAAMLAYAEDRPAVRPTRRGGLVPAAAHR